MEHWFDRASKLLAGDSVSRRAVLKSAALSAVGTLMPSWAGQFAGATRSSRMIPVEPSTIPLSGSEAVCTRQSRGGERIITLSAVGAHRGQSLTLQSAWTTMGAPFSRARLDQRVDLGGSLVYELSAHVNPGLDMQRGQRRAPSAVPAISADMRFGPVVRGPRRLHFTTQDGSVRVFADGQHRCDERLTEHLVAVDSALRESVLALAAKARQSLSGCRTVRGPVAQTRRPPAGDRQAPHFQRAGLTMEIASREGETALAAGLVAPAMPQQNPNETCDQCLTQCEIQTSAFGAATVGQGLAGDPVGFILGFIGDITGMWDCYHNCDQQGGACCSTPCPGGSCCGTHQFCCGSAANPAFGQVCCDDGAVCTTVTDPLYGPVSFCCPAGSDSTGCLGGNPLQYSYVCRKAGEECCGLWGPCPEGQFCGSAWADVCCANGQVICNTGAYIGYGEFIPTCCEGTCITHNAGTTAQYQECCPSPNVACGESCCAPGHCLTTSKGEKVCCDQATLCGDVCCDWPATCSNGVCGIGPCGNTFCGLFATCCNGVCCDLNETCTNGKCVPTACPAGKVPCAYLPGQCCPPGFQCCGINVCCDPNTTECCGGRGCVPKGTCVIVN